MAIEVWSELDDALVTDNQGNILKDINIDAVKASIRNMLGTSRGERTFLPQFGSNLDDLLFDPMNSNFMRRISENIKSNIEIWDDRVIVTGVDINADPDHNSVEISVNFMVKSYTETFTTTAVITP